MFEKNTKSSVIKVGIDAWYKRYLNDYSLYIEDTIFCNDRTVINYGGFKDDGGKVNEHLFFRERNISNSLNCANENDQFSVSNDTYPIALMSSSEMHLLNNNEIRRSSNFYYVLSPTYYYHLGVCSRGISADGSDNNDGRYVIDAHGVRPAISLVPGIEYSSGDGSVDNPYVVETY